MSLPLIRRFHCQHSNYKEIAGFATPSPIDCVRQASGNYDNWRWHQRSSSGLADAFRLYNGEVSSLVENDMDKKIRVLIAKPGLDGHDRGAKVVARALRDAGMEVIYTGLRQTPEMVAEAALQEDVDAIGLSILSGAHLGLVPRVMELLKANGQNSVHVFVGGIIPEEDIPALKKMGVMAVYGPGTTSETYIADIRKAVLGEAAAA